MASALREWLDRPNTGRGVHLAADDGGWDIAFPSWTPVTRPEWRGFVTVDRLLTLRAYGRLKP